MKSLGTFLDKKYSQTQSKIVIDEKTVLFLMGKFLEEEYGKRGAAQLLPKYFHDGRLGMLARSSLWANEARNDTERIRMWINRELGSEVVTEIRIRHEFGS